jgi:hypothetical protein
MQQEVHMVSIRKTRQLERMARARKSAAVPRVRVVPRDDDVRVMIKHPRAGAFRSTGSVEWPYDTFTKRRVREGVVMLEPSRDAAASGRTPRASESTSTA